MAGLGLEEDGDMEEQIKAAGLGPACRAAYLAIRRHGSVGAAAREASQRCDTFKDHLRTAIRRGLPDPRPADAVRRTTAKPGAVTASAVLSLVESQGHRCALSGRNLKPETASLDHKLPLSRGGEHCIANAQVVHEQVQRAKGNMTDDEFLALCRDVVVWAKRKGKDITPDEGMFAA